MQISRRLFLTASAAAVAQSARPNIVFVITDDQGYGDIGRHGNPVLKTPHMDALHDQSLVRLRSAT